MQNGIDLDQVVNLYLDQEEAPDSLYRRIYTLGIRAYRQIYMHCTGTMQTVELEVLGNKTAVLPCDCLNPISVNILGANGSLSPLTKLDSIGFNDDDNPNRLDQQPQTPPLRVDNSIYYDANGNYLSPFVFGQFGVGARSDLGFYNIDMKSRLIVFDFAFAYGSVWMEYLPVASDDGKYIVNPFFVEAILGFMAWKDKRNSQSDRAEGKMVYYNEMRIGRRSMKPFDPDQVYLQYNRTTRQARF